MNSKYKILLVDDEEDVREFLTYNLKKEGYSVFNAKDGESAIKLAKDIVPNLIVLDIMMPGIDGIETCKKLREFNNLRNAIIVFLSARGDEFTEISGFEAGGDDYINKPIKPTVFLSKVKALLKRSDQFNSEVHSDRELIEFGNIKIDKARYLVIKENEELKFPKKEFELLLLLTSDVKRVFTRDEIYKKVWGEDIVVGDRTIDVHIRMLRKKLGTERVITVKGIGYKFEA